MAGYILRQVPCPQIYSDINQA